MSLGERVQLDGAAVGGFGFGELTLVAERVAEIGPSLSEFGIERDGATEVRDGLGTAPRQAQGVSEIVVSVGVVGAELNCLGAGCDRVVGVIVGSEQVAQVVPGFGKI